MNGTVVERPRTYRARGGDRRIRVGREGVLEALRTDEVVIDVRTPQEYAGEFEPSGNGAVERAGHIPGARSIPWALTVNEDGSFKTASELRDLYRRREVASDDVIITYCHIGERSAHTWFVLHELLGHTRVMNYDGSWAEWGNLIDAPIERGHDSGDSTPGVQPQPHETRQG